MMKTSRSIQEKWCSMAVLIVFAAVMLAASITPALASTITPQVSTGNDHTLAIKSDGTLWAWGYNEHGKWGIGNTINLITSPVQVGTEKNWCIVQASLLNSEIRTQHRTVYNLELGKML